MTTAIIELIKTEAAEISFTLFIEGWISGCKWLHNFSIAEFKASAVNIMDEIIKTANHSVFSILNKKPAMEMQKNAKRWNLKFLSVLTKTAKPWEAKTKPSRNFFKVNFCRVKLQKM